MNRRIYDAGASTDDPRRLPLLLNVRQAAELLGVTDVHVRRLCNAGEIKAAKVGSSWRINRTALLEQFGIEGSRVGGHEQAGYDGGASAVAGRQSETKREPVEVVIRIELPADLAERLANTKVVVSPVGRGV